MAFPKAEPKTEPKKPEVSKPSFPGAKPAGTPAPSKGKPSALK